MNLPDFLTYWPDGEIMFTGHRVGLYHVMAYHKQGCTPAMLQQLFPTLSPALIENVLAFARENQEEVEVYLTRYQEDIDQRRAARPRLLDWDDLGKRFAALKEAKRQ